jgi:hypothetical protein
MAATAKKAPNPATPVKRSVPQSAKSRAPEAAPRRPIVDDDAATPAGGENLDKVRDILFGAQMRDQDRRFARLEERLAKDLADVRDETKARLESLEAYVKKEVQTLIDRLKNESSQRNDAVKGVSQELKETTKSIGDLLKTAEERIAEEHREIRDELLGQSKSLRDELQRSAQDSAAATLRAAEELRGEKADRAALADLFTEMALRLNSDSGQPSRRK